MRRANALLKIARENLPCSEFSCEKCPFRGPKGYITCGYVRICQEIRVILGGEVE